MSSFTLDPSPSMDEFDRAVKRLELARDLHRLQKKAQPILADIAEKRAELAQLETADVLPVRRQADAIAAAVAAGDAA